MKNCVTGKEGPLKVVEARTCVETLYPKNCAVSKCTSDCISKHGSSGRGKCDFTGACICTYFCN